MAEKVTEREVEESLAKGVKKLGGRAYKFVSPGNAGVPDRIVILPGGKIIFVELKRPGGKTTALQDVQIQRLQDLGCDVGIVSSLQEVKDCLEYCSMEIESERKRKHEIQTTRLSGLLHPKSDK